MALALLAAAAPAGVAAPAPYRPRPHADFSLRDAGVQVARFDVRARPRGRRVLVSVTLTGRSRAKDMRTVLRVGRCTGGPPTFPICEPVSPGRAVTFRPGRTTVVNLNVRVPRPSVKTNAIRISLTPPGRVVRPFSSPFVGIVEVLLPASAWTTFAGRSFGLRVARPWEGDHLPYDVRSVAARSAQLDHDHLRPTLAWVAQVPVATQVTTQVEPCSVALTLCVRSWQTVSNQIGRASFGERPRLVRTEAEETLSFGARGTSGRLFTLTLPWPR